MSYTQRVVALIDMDCFYCQVEENLDQSLVGKPIAVVQYNQWKGGGIIAVNYIAREKGVTRQMRGEEAKKICPDIELPRVPQVRGKADLTKYRDAGKKVAEVLMSFSGILERASIDEAYLDITEAVNIELQKGLPIISSEDLGNTFVVGAERSDFLSNVYKNQVSGFCDDDMRLAIGGAIIEKVRAEVLKKTGYKCSAGIAHNKTLAKLVCGLHKPNKQTILPQHAVPELFAKLPIRKIKSLGGKFGHTLSEMLNVEFIGEITKFSEKELIRRFDEKNGKWLYNISRGIDKEPVQSKVISKSIGCCKRFPGRNSLCKAEEVEHWIRELSTEISERLEEDLRENSRRAKLVTVSFSQETKQTEVSSTRAVPLKSYEIDKIALSAYDVIKKNCKNPDGSYHITFLGLSVGNFENVRNVRSITSFFKATDKDKIIQNENSCDRRENETSYESYIKNEKHKNYNFDENEANELILSIPTSFTTKTEDMKLKDNTDGEAEDEKSNYSDSTVELDETKNPDNLIFYDVKCNSFDSLTNNKTNECSESDKKTDNQNNKGLLLQRNVSATSVDSLENEMYLDNLSRSISPILNSETQKSGFFSKYFENKDRNSVCNRDFDTSKIFEGCSDGESSDQELPVAESNESEISTQNLEACRECGEMVLVDDLSHMDYHLAVKMSKENYSPIKNDKLNKKTNDSNRNKLDTKTNDSNRNASKKRKSRNDSQSITSFFKRDQVGADEPSEVCSECNRTVKLVDIETHSDYHAAKKLHMELNRPSVISVSQPETTLGDSKRGKESNPKNMKPVSIVSFFKRNGCD